MKVILSVCN